MALRITFAFIFLDLVSPHSSSVLVETFKIVPGLVNYGQNMFKVSRSGCNLVSKGIKVSRARQDFFGERVIQYYNLLPACVKE